MLTEIKRNLELRFSLIQIICLFVLFVSCAGYLDDKGNVISIMGLLIDSKDLIRELDLFEIWSNGITRYSSIVYPLLVCLGYSFSMYYEKKGVRRSILIRKKRSRYCFDKITGAMIAGGLIFGAAYMMLGIVIRVRAVSVLMLFGMEKSEFFMCLIKLVCSFIYGMELSLFFIVVSVFFDDKYVLMCLPILIKYMLQIVSDRTVIFGMKADNNVIVHISQVTLNPENMISNYSSLAEKAESLIIMTGVYVLTIFLLDMRIRRNGGYGNI